MRLEFKNTAALLLSCLIGALLNITGSAAEVDQAMMTKQQVDEVIASGKLKLVKSKSDFPEFWRASTGLTSMSDIGGPFSSGCTGPPPHCRMIAGAVSDRYGLIIYEQGGVAYFCNLKLYRHENNKVDCVYSEGVDQARIDAIRKKLSN